VTSYNKEFLWFLARTPTVDEALIERFKAVISNYDFDQQNLIWVDQS
jgi:apolipoprotein D and lipocalin family protein